MPRTRITYEWHIECIAEDDVYDDIDNVDFADTYADAIELRLAYMADYAIVRIALVQTHGDQEDGIADRYYAYVNGGELERTFSSFHPDGFPANDGGDVPQRYFREVDA